MKKFKYFKISKYSKLRYMDNYSKKNPYVIFLPGFMSDIEGRKPQAFKKYAVKKDLGFLTLEYFGHGKSSCKFVEGNISIWTNNVKFLIKKIVKKNNFIIIGSSMGAWLALNQFKYFKNQIKGLIGIGSAPEFLSRLMWNKFPKKTKNEIKKKKIVTIKNGQYTYPISLQLIKDGKKNKVFSKKISQELYITMFHGKKDEVVPLSFSRKVCQFLKMEKRNFLLLKKAIIVYRIQNL